jgi:hypothetical protein
MKLSFYLVLVIVLMSIYSCEKDTPGIPVTPADRLELKKGQKWKYISKTKLTLDDTTAANEDTIITHEYEYELEALGDSVVFGDTVFVFASGNLTDSTFGKLYYKHDSSGLYYLWSEGNTSNIISLRTKNNILCRTGNKLVNYAQLKRSLHDQDATPRVLQYPLKINKEWKMYHDTVSLNVWKKVIATQKVICPAGTFDCYKIQLEIKTHTEIKAYQYYAKQGLIARRSNLDKIDYSTAEQPDKIIGFLSDEEITTLVLYTE